MKALPQKLIAVESHGVFGADNEHGRTVFIMCDVGAFTAEELKAMRDELIHRYNLYEQETPPA